MPDAGVRGEDAPAPTAPALAPLARRPKRRRLLRAALLLVVPALVLAAAGYAYVSGGRFVSTDNAYVRADKLVITTDISGIVKEIAVRDNQPVAAGQVLFRLDDEPFRLALTRADAQLGAVRNEIETQKATYRQKQEDLKLVQTDIDFYEREYQRQAELMSRRVVAMSQYDQARRNLDASRQRFASTKQELAALAAGLGGDPDAPAERNPRYLDALARRDQAARDLRHTVVKAPFAGIVAKTPSLQPGLYLQSSAPAFGLIGTEQIWVEANPKETQLTHVRPGQRATITVDAYPGVTWSGTVASLSPASGAEFSLLPAQNTTGNWVKVVQRIPVRIQIDPAANMPALRAGMSCEVEIDTGHRRGLPELIESALAAAPWR